MNKLSICEKFIVNQETLRKFVFVESSSVEPEEILSQDVKIEDKISCCLVTEIIYEEHLDP